MNRVGRCVLVAIACAAIVSGVGCKKAGESKENTAGDGEKASGGGASITLKKVDHVALFEHAPKGAQAVVTFNLGSFWSAAIDENFGLVPVKKDPKAVREAVGRASRKGFGVDLTAAKEVVLWVKAGLDPEAGGPMFAAHIAGDFKGTVTGEKAGKHQGVELFKLESGPVVASVDGAVLLGNEAGVKLGIELAKGEATSLAKGDKSDHEAALKLLGGGALNLTVSLGIFAGMIPKPFKGLSGGSFSISPSGGIGAAVLGDESTLDGLLEQLEGARKLARQQLEKLGAQMREGGPPEALMLVVFLEEKLDDYMSVGRPEKVDGGLKMELETGGSGGVAVAVAAVMSVVAVPAFIKYMRRAKTTEAIDYLDRIYKAASVYYTTPRVQAGTGMRLPCQFPATQKLTPAPVGGKHPCCGPQDADKDDRCDVDMSAWTTATWSALNFQMNDQHYFAYEYESSGTGAAAKFTARAYADLDCDGVFSTFERSGYGDPSASMAECSMKGSSAFYKNLETE